MNAEQDLDRNERATPFKLAEARKRGQVAKSTDAVSFMVLLVASLGFFALMSSALQAMSRLMASGISASSMDLTNAAQAMHVVSGGIFAALRVVAPLLFLLVVGVLAVHVLQNGVVFSTLPLKPDWNRLNPMTGFKRLFSLKLLYEGMKSALKLGVLVFVAWVAIEALMPGMTRVQGMPAKTYLATLVDAAGGLATKLCAVLSVFAVADLVYARWDFLRNMRMSRREMTDESKNRDGDPRIKQRLRELRLEFLRRTRAVKNVPQADVLITNPTHVAVALQYRHGESPAPRVIAKGAGGVARRMRELAYRSNVPIVQSPTLARALFKEVEQEAYVPEHRYAQVAKILVWVQAARAAGKGATQGGAST